MRLRSLFVNKLNSGLVCELIALRFCFSNHRKYLVAYSVELELKIDVKKLCHFEGAADEIG